MDPSASSDLVAILATVGGVVGAGGLAVLAARRARAARRRQIEAADGPRPQVSVKRRTLELDDVEPEPAGPEPEPVAPPARAPAAPPAAGPPPAPAARPGAQILPFQRPVGPQIDLPVDKPTPPAPALDRVKRRDAAALVPGLAKTRGGWVARLGQMFAGRKQIEPALVEELEKVLLTADIGVRTSQKLLDDVKSSLGKKELGDTEAIWTFLRRRCREILSFAAPPVTFEGRSPFVLLVIGVNGSGKTTTIGKLAAQLRARGKSVILGAGDTFRAAAAEQLEVWAGRVGVPVVRGKEGADPSSVIFDTIKRAKSEGIDVVIADTAGRLHTKTELMQELQKVRRVVAKADESAPHETWLVIDATSGQNAIAQAQIFTQAMAVSGIVLTKLDGTAKGGVILGIADQLGIPVRYIGVGERVEDLREFDPEEFVEALFEGQSSPASAA
jgi:fused signal recognition particle receptor